MSNNRKVKHLLMLTKNLIPVFKTKKSFTQCGFIYDLLFKSQIKNPTLLNILFNTNLNMKRPYFLLFCFLFSLLLLFSHCKKDRFDLPPETTTGAMTFGCKVNGKVFVPRDGRGKPGLYCQYVNLGEGEGGGWFLNIPAVDWKASPNEIVAIATDSY